MHRRPSREQLLPPICAECQGISVKSKIVERLEMTGIASAHSAEEQGVFPGVRLKPDTTEMKPPEAWQPRGGDQAVAPGTVSGFTSWA